jgi:protein-tyrosine phosphatase
MLPFLRPPGETVLFVCTANVCRSPLAEALLRHRLQRAGLQRRVAVRSAGTRVAQPGRRPDPRLRPLLGELGVPLPRIRARQVTPAVLDGVTEILVMTGAQRRELEALGGGPLPPVRELRSLLGEPGDIADPYFADPATFRTVFEQVAAAVAALADELAARAITAG